MEEDSAGDEVNHRYRLNIFNISSSFIGLPIQMDRLPFPDEEDAWWR